MQDGGHIKDTEEESQGPSALQGPAQYSLYFWMWMSQMQECLFSVSPHLADSLAL